MIAFIFVGGWGNVRKKHIGPVGQFECPNCHQVSQWDVYDIEKRATAFFVPVFKYASQRVIICSRCGAGAEATDAEIAELRRSLLQPPARKPTPAPTAGSPKAAPSTSLGAWLNEVSTYVAGKGYAETERQGCEESADCPGVRSIASAMYRAGTTLCQVMLFDDSQSAQRWVTYISTNEDMAQRIARGQLKIDSFDRRAYFAHDPRGVSDRSFRRWTKAAVHVAPPVVTT